MIMGGLAPLAPLAPDKLRPWEEENKENAKEQKKGEGGGLNTNTIQTQIIRSS